MCRSGLAGRHLVFKLSTFMTWKENDCFCSVWINQVQPKKQNQQDSFIESVHLFIAKNLSHKLHDPASLTFIQKAVSKGCPQTGRNLLGDAHGDWGIPQKPRLWVREIMHTLGPRDNEIRGRSSTKGKQWQAQLLLRTDESISMLAMTTPSAVVPGCSKVLHLSCCFINVKEGLSPTLKSLLMVSHLE